MVFILSKEEVLKVCQECQQYNKSNYSCNSGAENREISLVRKCDKWDKYFGGPCLYRG